jgi:hypothetical protein
VSSKPDSYTRLREKDRKFVEGICAGMSPMEAARYAGSNAADGKSIATVAYRWQGRRNIKEAIRELRALHAVDDDGLWDLTKRALRELLQERANPNARARACELMAKLLGKLQPDRHEHVHAHFEFPDAASPEGRAEVVRLVRIALEAMDPTERIAVVQEALGGIALPAEVDG